MFEPDQWEGALAGIVGTVFRGAERISSNAVLNLWKSVLIGKTGQKPVVDCRVWRRPREVHTEFRPKIMRMTISVVFVAAFTISGAAQDSIAQSGVPAVAFPKPDRPVADIVSPIWHDEKERDDADEPGQLVRLLGIKSGMTVADIGAGSGYYVVRLSSIVGSNGRIIAEDIVPKYLRSLRKRVRDLGLRNVVIGLGEPHDPKLPADSVDVAILVHMYHEIEQPYALLYNLVPALKPEARVGIVDAFGPTSKHGTPPTLLRCELAAVGYREISLDRLTGSDAYLAIFAPPSVASRTRPEAIVACKAR
jgi:SAM-dependent methyltransferase